MPECQMCYRTLELRGSGRAPTVCDACARAISERFAARKPWDSDCAFCGKTLVMVRAKAHALTCSSRCRSQLHRILSRYPATKPAGDAGTASLF